MSYFDAGSPPSAVVASTSGMSPPSQAASPARKRPRKNAAANRESTARQSSVGSSRYNSVAPMDSASAILASGAENVSVFDFLHAAGTYNAAGATSTAAAAAATNKRKRGKFTRGDSEQRGLRFGTASFGAGGDDELAQPTTGKSAPADEGQQADQEFNLDWDAAFDEEQREADRRYQEMLPQVAALREKMDADQLARYDMAFNDHTKTIQPARINEFLQLKYGFEVSRDLAMVVSILGKTHIGEMVERARALQAFKGVRGPLTPQLLREAHRDYLVDVERSEKAKAGTRPKRNLFGGI